MYVHLILQGENGTVGVAGTEPGKPGNKVSLKKLPLNYEDIDRGCMPFSYTLYPHGYHLYDVYHHTVVLETMMYIIIQVHFYG